MFKKIRKELKLRIFLFLQNDSSIFVRPSFSSLRTVSFQDEWTNEEVETSYFLQNVISNFIEWANDVTNV